ncbi:DUF3473 domain-containing protein [Photobacterium sp. BZF1]|nr:DUF3473 domain-containing protein [Photobacterium sp. BZF1]
MSSQCALTVDVEDYFHVAAFDKHISADEWGAKYPLRVERTTHRLLELFSENNAKATFFMLGWVAEACPNLARAIVDNGHELASHGYAHQKATSQSPEAFKLDVYRSKVFLEDTVGHRVNGYRAPSFSIDPRNEWAFSILAELGFIYSSSTYPVNHDHYGAPDWPKFKYLRPEGIYEIPIPTLEKAKRSIPIGGGGFFRLYPYQLSRFLINQYLQRTNQPYSFYFHPWEIDAGQPSVKGIPLKSRFRHYLNLNRTESRIQSLLADFSWNTMTNVYQLDGICHEPGTKNQENERSRHFSMG